MEIVLNDHDYFYHRVKLNAAKRYCDYPVGDVVDKKLTMLYKYNYNYYCDIFEMESGIANLIYAWKCLSCKGSFYVGRTRQTLKNRLRTKHDHFVKNPEHFCKLWILEYLPENASESELDLKEVYYMYKYNTLKSHRNPKGRNTYLTSVQKYWWNKQN